MAMTGNGPGRTMSEINVTPMVDVMLVLLVIFMVTAPLLQQGVEVDLPQTRAETLDVNPDLLILTLTKEQKIFIGQEEILRDDLHDKLLYNIKLRADKEVYLQADRSLPYGFVVDVMALMKKAGVTNVGMVTETPDEP